TTEADVDERLESLPPGPMSPLVHQIMTRAQTDHSGDPGSRHDVTLKHVLTLFRRADEGDGGVAEALTELRKAVVRVVGKDRGEASARLEFDRMVRGQRGHDLIASTPGSRKADNLLGLADAAKKISEAREAVAELSEAEMDLLLFGPREAAPSEDDLIFGSPNTQGSVQSFIDDTEDVWEDWDDGDGEEDVRRSSWAARNVAEALAGDLKPEEPAALRRDDGQPLFYKGRIN